MNIKDELSLATDNNREAYAKLILNADAVIRFIDAVANDETVDIRHFRNLARTLNLTLSKTK